MSEAQIQSECVTWLWNTYPETRGLFFAVQNEGAKLSTKVIIAAMLFIIKNSCNPRLITQKANEVLDLCRKGNALGGAIARAMGLIPGVSDTILLWKGKAYLIEFKTPIGTQSQAQRTWERKVTGEGFDYYLVRSFDEFKLIICLILERT